MFIDGIDLSGMDFKTVAEVTGRPAYHPATMLMPEAGSNVELTWLSGRLAPDF